ncbi:hypothetical protein [Streptomyces sp. NPDC093568]|uniref:hypothetical protein n=1 Tax=Streptomyces sp. NPDC093568 TaxID=3366041 RepID=UPI003813E5F2
MRRTVRALSLAALAGAALGTAASAASADPAAEVSPGTVAPGGSVTVSVSCDPLDGSAPATIDAVSQAFEDGTVELKRVSGNDEKAAGPAYHGTTRVPPAENSEGAPDAAGPESAWTVDGTCPAAGEGEGKEWSAKFTVAHESGGAGSGGGGGTESGKDGEAGGESGDGGAAGWTAEGGGRTCPEPHAGRSEGGKEESDRKTGTGSDQADPYADTTGTEQAEPPADATEPTEPTGPYWDAGGQASGQGGSQWEDCGGDVDQHGVQAGTGGVFTDSVPALVAGGLLIAGAFGGAAYRLRRRAPGADD